MKTRKAGLKALLIFAAAGLNGCSLIVGTAVVGAYVGVAAVGVAGYTVYKGGEAVVSSVEAVGSTVGSVGSSIGGSTKRTVTRHRDAVVVSRGTFKTKSKHTIAELHPAAELVFVRSGFVGVQGGYDSLSGEINATNRLGDYVYIRLELIDENRTSVEIRVGSGNLKQSEYLYDQMLATFSEGDAGAIR